MVVIIHLAFLGAVAPSPSIHSLELEAFLHGGEPNEALIVSQLYSADDIAYRDALEDLKEAQDIRFLMELGFNRIEIGGKDTLLAIHVHRNPSDQVIRESVVKLRTALQTAGCDLSADNVIPLNLVQQIMDFSPVPPKRKLHRINQMTFLIERFDSFKSRFLSDDNVNGHVNHDQTRTEELDTVYRILYGETRPDAIFLEDFNLAKINLNLAEIGLARWDVFDVSQKLTIPYKEAPNMLSLAIDFALKARDKKYLGKLRLLVRQLWVRYSAQVREYSAFIVWVEPAPPTLTGNLIEDIRIVHGLRRLALRLYESFKLPFPTAENRVFSIYLHDPEGRGLRFGQANANAEGFNDLFRATVFAQEMVIPSFNEVPDFYYSRLRDVVLFRKGHVLARTLDMGRAIALFHNDEPLDTIMYVVRHECGHVFHYKMGLREIENRILEITRLNPNPEMQRLSVGIERLLSSEMQALLERTHNLFRSPHSLKPVAYADYKDAIYNEDKKNLMWAFARLVDLIKSPRNPQTRQARKLKEDASRFTGGDLSPLVIAHDRLKTAVEFNERMHSHFHGMFLGINDDSFGSSSYYGMRNAKEDVAELFQQLASHDMREALFVQVRSDAILRQKVALLLKTFDKKLVHGWFANREGSQMYSHLEPPVTAVIVSKFGKESLEAIKSARSYVAQQIRRNRNISLLHMKIYPHMKISLHILQQSNVAFTDKPKIRFFPQSASKEHLSAMTHVLKHLNVGFDGRQVQCVRRIISGTHV